MVAGWKQLDGCTTAFGTLMPGVWCFVIFGGGTLFDVGFLIVLLSSDFEARTFGMRTVFVVFDVLRGVGL